MIFSKGVRTQSNRDISNMEHTVWFLFALIIVCGVFFANVKLVEASFSYDPGQGSWVDSGTGQIVGCGNNRPGNGDTGGGSGGVYTPPKVRCVSNMGSACVSPSNRCGGHTNGKILCDGSCSVTTAPAVTNVYGSRCISPINKCGEYREGTFLCDCSCSVTTAPAVPAGGCTTSCSPKTGKSCTSKANACGDSSTGKFMCDGVTCSAKVPPVPARGCGPVVTEDPEVKDLWIKADPMIVRYGESTTITWNGGNANACTVTGYGLTDAQGVNGEEVVPNMEGESTYTLMCTLGPKNASDTVKVRVLPRVQET